MFETKRFKPDLNLLSACENIMPAVKLSVSLFFLLVLFN